MRKNKFSEKIFLSRSESDTRQLGRELGKNFSAGALVLLYGDLGTGKTVFVKGVGDSLNISGVRSPSFTLVNEYKSDTGIFLIHIDLYRLEDNDGVEALGLEDYINSGDTITLIEWPERWANIPENQNTLKIYFQALNENEREIRIHTHENFSD